MTKDLIMFADFIFYENIYVSIFFVFVGFAVKQKPIDL